MALLTIACYDTNDADFIHIISKLDNPRLIENFIELWRAIKKTSEERLTFKEIEFTANGLFENKKLSFDIHALNFILNMFPSKEYGVRFVDISVFKYTEERNIRD